GCGFGSEFGSAHLPGHKRQAGLPGAGQRVPLPGPLTGPNLRISIVVSACWTFPPETTRRERPRLIAVCPTPPRIALSPEDAHAPVRFATVDAGRARRAGIRPAEFAA